MSNLLCVLPRASKRWEKQQVFTFPVRPWLLQPSWCSVREVNLSVGWLSGICRAWDEVWASAEDAQRWYKARESSIEG